MSTADLIVRADTVHTMDRQHPTAEAVAVSDGAIVAVGSVSELLAWRGAHTELVDLGDATLTPGLVDGHCHPVLGLSMTRGVDLGAVTTVRELVETLQDPVARDPSGWVIGWGLDPNAFAGEPLSYAPLVEACGEARVFLLGFDGHSALVSPAALREAGLVGADCAPNASVVRDPEGRATGHLLELAAYEILRRVIPPESTEIRRGKLLALLSDMAATGLTAADVMDLEGDSEMLISLLAESPGLPVRLRCAPLCLSGGTRSDLEEMIALQGHGGDRWRVEGVKFMIDGTVDTGTAWLREPDRFGESTTSAWPDPQAYVDAVRHVVGAGVPTITHAIGDAAIRFVLDTLDGLPPTSVPHRIEHVETLPDDLVGRFAAQNVTAGVQPTHCTLFARADGSDNWSVRLGPERASRGWRTRDLRDAGARLTLGSDWPVAPYDPRSILADAQLRRPNGRPEAPTVHQEQALTALEALEGYTTHAAAAAGLSRVAGRIRPGCRADLTAFGLDPLSAPPDELAEAPVRLTVVDGSIVHRA